MKRWKDMSKEEKGDLIWDGLCVAGTIAAIAIPFIILRRCKCKLDKDLLEKLRSAGVNSHIDESIFTELAPWVEDAVLEEGEDEAITSFIYEVKFPKCGNWDNGSYTVKKCVDVIVRDMCDL